ncbi:MFS general substrate transporter [Penicillium cinerascens]|uniref:MFS general substrate transporter n=1 Tax=Penicillium cinerascens TaxID=70096 RepID=A0A9W9NG11_9EURO|nr:MFS general substrate transporter [Penicillium cinerascens]KAJ5219191.1 MFS general substrate transporter [Penicillium cinerascens]
MSTSAEHPGWRSSRKLVTATACVALFTETLLSGFPVPMLPYMLEERLRNDPSRTIDTTNSLLSLHGFVTMICSPVFARFFDKTSNQKGPLFLSLGLCLAGTVLVAYTPTCICHPGHAPLCSTNADIWALYLGRVLQAVAGSAAWLVCTAMITETAGDGRIGRVMGLSTSFIMIGTVSGPMLGGVLLGLVGYWAAWSVPMGLLFLDMIARLVMIQPERHSLDSHASSDKAKHSKSCHVTPSDSSHDVEGVDTETSPLLSSSASTTVSTIGVGSDSDTEVGIDTASVAENRNFYAVVLRDIGIWTSILNTIVQAAVRAGFNATLPVYLRDTFNWGPSSVGATFFALQVPIVFLSPVLGWVRDRVGVRYPTTIGWVLLCPLLCCLGIPGSGIFWASDSQRIEEAAFIACICGIGLVMPFTQGAGALNMRNVVRTLEKETPNIFGPNGGRARCFALISVSFNTGLTLGPAIIGWLFGNIGYCYMNILLGR